MSSGQPPFNPEELQKELQKLLKGKFGSDAKIEIAQFPEIEDEEVESDFESEEEAALKFDYQPKDVKEYLDRFVIGQDEAKVVLSTVICDHYNHVRDCMAIGGNCTDYAKQNIIMMGPTGIGKTYLIRHLAKLIGVPFVKADATKFSETGYVGADVEDLVRELVSKANGNSQLAQYGIIYLDEVDKIASDPRMSGRDVSGRGVQFGLLKLLEETDVPLRSPMDIQAQIQAMMDFQQGNKPGEKTINTRHILFIVSGAFNSLEEVIQRRVGDQRVGFTTENHGQEAEDYLRLAQSVDFVEYGFEPEFIGRLPVSVFCHNLAVEDLFEVLRFSEGSIIRQVEAAFQAYGIDIVFTEEALVRIAEKAHESKTGARALVSVLERALRHFKFELPSREVTRLVVTPETIDEPAEQLEIVLNDPDVNTDLISSELIRRFEKAFKEEHGITVHFDDDAVAFIIEKCKAEGTDPDIFCEELLKDYEYGLILIRKNTSQDEFILPRDVVENPTDALNNWIRDSVDAGKKEEDDKVSEEGN